jgi:hypothetical protein
MNKAANDDSISRVFPKKTNLCFREALGSLMFLLGRGCQRLGQPIEKPISPRPSGTGIFPYSRMPALKLKRRPIFKAPLRGASTDGAIETGFPEGDLSFRVRSTRLNIDNYFFKVFTQRLDSDILTSPGINFNPLVGKSGGGWWSGKGFLNRSEVGTGVRQRRLAMGCRDGAVRQ